jgi:hypothetical protein
MTAQPFRVARFIDSDICEGCTIISTQPGAVSSRIVFSQLGRGQSVRWNAMSERIGRLTAALSDRYVTGGREQTSL